MNLDLIYGMEGQGLDGWTRVVERLRGIAPDSVTAYQLRLRLDTASLNRYRKARDAFADDAETLLMHAVTQQGLVEEGDYAESPVDWYVHASQPTHRYQTLNWRDTDEVPLLGFGPSAYGYVGGCQYYNINDLADYALMVSSGRLPVFRGEVLTPDERWRRACVLGLKMGLHMPSLAATHGGAAARDARRAAAEPLALGLIADQGDWLRLTPTGTLLADEVGRTFASAAALARTVSIPATVISTTSRKLNSSQAQ